MNLETLAYVDMRSLAHFARPAIRSAQMADPTPTPPVPEIPVPADTPDPAPPPTEVPAQPSSPDTQPEHIAETAAARAA